MANKLFIDTWGWLTLHDKGERYHNEATQAYQLAIAQTQVLRSKFLDKPLISFTDLTSMVVMQECKITTILTQDAHFTHVNMGFELVP